MKFLILSVTTGHGHNQTASAIKNEIEKHGHQADILDAFEHISKVIYKSLAKGYLLSTSKTPKAFGRFYRSAEKKVKRDTPLSFQNISNTLFSKKITGYINETKPDVIICTHVFGALTFRKDELEYEGVKLAGIITDYTIHPYWDVTDLDYYIIPNEKLEYQAAFKGIKGKILPFGIPILPEFSEKEDKKTAREKLGIPDKKTVLVMSGSMGFGKVYKNLIKLDGLKEDFQIITVCGNNKKLKEKIDRKGFEKIILNYGYTKNVSELMNCADIIITKPGGITVSESLAKKLPMILSEPIPGHEERNCEFLQNVGAAIRATDTYPINEALHMLLSDDDRRESMVKSIEKIRKPNAAENLVKFFIEKNGSE